MAGASPPLFQTAPVEICAKCRFSIPHSSVPSIDPSSDYNTPLNRPVAGQALEDIENELRRYNEHITQLENGLQSVKRERDKLSARRDEWRQAISPIQRLPVEALTEIFFVACTEPDDVFKQFQFLQNPIFHIAQVCTQWRNISLALPRLWARLVVDLQHGACTSPRIVDLHLKHSNNLLLDVGIHFPRVQSSDNDGCNIEAFNMLSYHDDPEVLPCHCSTKVLSHLIGKSAARWRSLVISEYANSWVGWIQLAQNKLTNLTSLRMLFSDCEIEDDYIETFNHIQSLAHVELVNCRLLDTRLHWPGLITIDLDAAASTVLQLLCDAPNIAHVTLTGIVQDTPQSLRQMVVAPSVTSLYLGWDIDIDLVLPWVTLPNMENLSMALDDLALSTLCEFLKRSASNLRTLSILYSSTPLKAEAIIDALRLTPQLSTLNIREDIDGDRTLLDYFTYMPTQRTLPRLSTLSLSCQDDEMDRLVSMLESRVTNGRDSSGSKLEEISLHIKDAKWKPSPEWFPTRPTRSDPLPLSFVSRMKAIIATGVRVQISPPLDSSS